MGVAIMGFASLNVVASFLWACWTEPLECRAGQPGEGHMIWRWSMGLAEVGQSIYQVLRRLHRPNDPIHTPGQSEVSYDRGLGRDYGLALDEVD